MAAARLPLDRAINLLKAYICLSRRLFCSFLVIICYNDGDNYIVPHTLIRIFFSCFFTHCSFVKQMSLDNFIHKVMFAFSVLQIRCGL